ncbi:MAG: PQQ-binding-like beta-propeller repeat protein [Verrucomicrobiales bacterium]
MKLRTLAVLACALAASQFVSAEDWPWFRGPSRQGASQETGLPLQWNSESNILWKVQIPGEAWSSPIVHGEKVFVTTTLESGVKCHVICYEKGSGKELWNTYLFDQTPRRKESRNSYATPTPATDGEMVYTVFGDGSIAALDLAGNVKWTWREFKFYSQHGLGASPLLHGDLIIMPFDHSSTGQNKRLGWQLPWDQSFLIAFDKNSGKEKWKTMRGQSRIAHVTPNLMEHEGKTILVSGAGDVIQGYDMETGEQLWNVYSQGEGVVPSIVIGDGLIYSVSGYEKPTIRAVKPGGKGDVTETHIAWEQKKNVPAIPSLIYKKPHLFAITEGGVASCMDANTGEIIWQERVGGNHAASPVLAGNHIYFTSEEGETTVIEAGAEFKIIARNQLGERVQASPAVSDGIIFIRTEKHLFAIKRK